MEEANAVLAAYVLDHKGGALGLIRAHRHPSL